MPNIIIFVRIEHALTGSEHACTTGNGIKRASSGRLIPPRKIALFNVHLRSQTK